MSAVDSEIITPYSLLYDQRLDSLMDICFERGKCDRSNAGRTYGAAFSACSE
jgi:hypothetical protein